MCDIYSIEQLKRSRVSAIVDIFTGGILALTAIVTIVELNIDLIPSTLALNLPNVMVKLDAMPGEISKGELMIIVLLVMYAGVYGMRLISHSLDKLRDINSAIDNHGKCIGEPSHIT